MVPLTWPVYHKNEKYNVHLGILQEYKDAFTRSGVLEAIIKQLDGPLSMPFR